MSDFKTSAAAARQPNSAGVDTAGAAKANLTDKLSARDIAAKRAAEIRAEGSLRDKLNPNDLHVEGIPEGWTYEWKRASTMGQEDTAYQVDLKRRGFEPVPREDHPEMMPSNVMGNTIERNGLILMRIPTEIKKEYENISLQEARAAVRDQNILLGQAPKGTFERTLVDVKRSHAPANIPD